MTGQGALMTSQRGLRTSQRGLRANWRTLRANLRLLRASWRGLMTSQRGLRLLVVPLGYEVLYTCRIRYQQVRSKIQPKGLKVRNDARIQLQFICTN